MDRDVHLQLCVAHARLGHDTEFFDEVSQFLHIHGHQSCTQSLPQRAAAMELLCLSLPSLRKVTRPCVTCFSCMRLGFLFLFQPRVNVLFSLSAAAAFKRVCAGEQRAGVAAAAAAARRTGSRPSPAPLCAGAGCMHQESRLRGGGWGWWLW